MQQSLNRAPDSATAMDAVIDNRQLDALMELWRHEDRPQPGAYWWRVASMEKLVTAGYVEKYQPVSYKKALAYRLTTAGKELALKTLGGASDER